MLVAGGDEKGSLKSEAVKYGYETMKEADRALEASHNLRIATEYWLND
jgi:hypothetical protein